MSNTYRINELLDYFDNKKIIRTNELYLFYKKYKPNITKDAVILKRISRLIAKDYLQRIATFPIIIGTHQTI